MLWRHAVLLLASAALHACGAALEHTPAAQPEARGRRLMRTEPEEEEGNTFVPDGGTGSWELGGSVGTIMIHANVMRDGKVVGWGSTDLGQSQGLHPSTIFDPDSLTFEVLLGSCGIHDCKNAFCSGQVTTKDDEVLIFGGHGDDADDLRWFRRYFNSDRTVTRQRMSSARWYPTPVTLPDGRILVVGGVPDPGDAGYDGITRAYDAEPALDNPSYEIYDPESDSFSGDKWDMEGQLSAAAPIHTYPHVVLLPDGGVAVSSGKLLVKYDYAGYEQFTKAFDYESRPGPPWSYPQTGAGTTLPMFAPYDKLEFLAAGGTSKDYATTETAASDQAQIIDLAAGESATWRDVGPMPYPRVMGDAVILCDGTIGIFNGAAKGIGGWNENEGMTYEFKDGTSWECTERCSSASDPVYEPAIYDPATGKWSAPGSLEEMLKPRMYHSVAVLLPDCRVFISGSDVTFDQTAEIFSPPYLNKGPRPVVSSVAPAYITPGTQLTVAYKSKDPVSKALLIRASSFTHSMPFGARALWLVVSHNVGGSVMILSTPASSAKLPPGLYMLTLVSDKGVPSVATMITVNPTPPAPEGSEPVPWPPTAIANSSVTNSSLRGCARQLVVRPGDFCLFIAASMGMELDRFLAINPRTLNCTALQPGDVVCVKAAPPPPPPPPPRPSPPPPVSPSPAPTAAQPSLESPGTTANLEGSASPESTDGTSAESSGLSTAAQAGIAAGSTVAAVLLAVLAWRCWRKRKASAGAGGAALPTLPPPLEESFGANAKLSIIPGVKERFDLTEVVEASGSPYSARRRAKTAFNSSH